MKLATSQQLHEIDKRAIAEHGIASIDLMENAGKGIAAELAKRYPDRSRAAVVCGPGNNGGDGLALARLLSLNSDWDTTVWLCQTPQSNVTEDNETNLQRAYDDGIPVNAAVGAAFIEALSTSIVIDAILGTSASGPPRQYVSDVIKLINKHSQQTIAIDVPTGIDCSTGEVFESAVNAHLTITLGYSKPGLHISPGCDCVGELVVVNEFVPPKLLTDCDEWLKTTLTRSNDIKHWLPPRRQTRDSNKGTYGSILIIAGSQGFAGAACLASLGAARTGAGTVTLGVPESLIDVMMMRAPEVVMTRGFSQTKDRTFSLDAVNQIAEFARKMTAVGIGPGIGHEGGEISDFVLKLVSTLNKPMVIDADALSIIAALGDPGAEALRKRNAATIITPHPGEMARLLGCKTSDIQNDRIGSVRKAAEKYNCVALLKGDKTLIAHPDGRLAINDTGNAGMGSGGMGDVLTGIATTCLAQIGDSFNAAAAAAYIHGLAGNITRDEIGVAGILATDVAQKIPQAITRCLQD